MRRAVGLGKGSLKANQRGSVWPCGEMIGRSFTVSYSLAAIDRASCSAGNNLFASRIFIVTPQMSVASENGSIGSLSKISPHPEQMGLEYVKRILLAKK